MHLHRRNKRLSSPVSPIQDLTLRLSSAINSHSSSSPTPDPVKVDRTIDHAGVNAAFGISRKSAAPTPFTSPEMLPVPVDLLNLHEKRTSPLSLASSPALGVNATSASPDRLPLHLLELESSRSQSRSSSRSSRDRSYPPASFPVAFYDKHAKQRGEQLSTAEPSASPSKIAKQNSPNRSPYRIENTSVQRSSTTSKISPSRRTQDHMLTPTRSVSTRSRGSPSPGSDRIAASYRGRIHHYLSCPHTSPPATRPLNIQPRLDEVYVPPRSVIPGACFDCDTAQRRELESEILISYNSSISALIEDLSMMVANLESRSPISPLTPATQSTRLQSFSIDRSLASNNAEDHESTSRKGSYSSLVSEDQEGSAWASHIHLLESQISEMTEARDQEVRNVWRGYTQRWGPGTLGVLKSAEGNRSSASSARSVVSRTASLRSTYTQPGSAEGRMRLDWLRD